MLLQTKNKLFLFLLLAVSVCAMAVSGCGYQLGPDMPTVLQKNGTAPGSPLPTLKVKEVDNPTLHTWLTYSVRNHLRDEIGARHLAKWVDSGKADYEISIKVQSFTFRSWMRTEDDVTSLYSADMTLEGIVYRGDTNAIVWRSGAIAYYQTYETMQEEAASEDLVLNLIRQLVDKMRNNF